MKSDCSSLPTKGVPHPKIRVFVSAFITLMVNPYRLERSRHYVRAALREAQPGPSLPLRYGSGDYQRLQDNSERSGPQPPVNPDPRVEWQPILALPFNIAVKWRKGVQAFRGGADRGDQVGESMLGRQRPHRAQQGQAEAARLVLRRNHGRQCAQRRGPQPPPKGFERPS